MTTGLISSSALAEYSLFDCIRILYSLAQDCIHIKISKASTPCKATSAAMIETKGLESERHFFPESESDVIVQVVNQGGAKNIELDAEALRKSV